MNERKRFLEVTKKNELDECVDKTQEYLDNAKRDLQHGNCHKALKNASKVILLLKNNGIDVSKPFTGNHIVEGNLKNILTDVNYIKGCTYKALGNDEKAIKAFELAATLNHGPSQCVLASIYENNLSACYNPMAAIKYIKMATDGEYDDSKKQQIFKYNNLLKDADIKIKCGKYELAKKELEEASRMINKLFYSEDQSSERSYVKSKEEANECLKGKKRELLNEESVRSLFSETANRYLTTDELILIQTSRMTLNFYRLLKTEYCELEYSGVIIPLTKCLENVLFELLGKEFFEYCNKEKVPMSEAPKSFQSKGNYDRAKLENMTLGDFVYTISKTGGGNGSEISIRQCFIDFMKSRGVECDEIISAKTVERLEKIKNRFRNVAAHKDWVGIEVAEQCYVYLLNETIRFIDKFLSTFYPDE